QGAGWWCSRGPPWVGIGARLRLPVWASNNCHRTAATRPPRPSRERRWRLRLGAVDFNHRSRKRLRGLLGKVVSDAALDRPVRIFAREFLGIGTRVRMGRTVGVTLKRNGGHGDHRTFGESFLERVVVTLAFSQLQP